MNNHFFIAGAQRSGTTYLYHILAQHPEIEMAHPVRPEPKFFLLDDLFERGIEYYERHFFTGKRDAWLYGEKSTSYMESEKAAVRISRCFADAKIIFLLRDPISRAISNYEFSVENRIETLPIEEAFLREEERRNNYNHKTVSASPYAYLKRGRYMDNISMYQRYFSDKNIKVLLQERLVTSPMAVADLFTFLSVRSDFKPSELDRVVNESEGPSISLSPALERYLLDYYADSNARLAKHFGLDLKEWR